MQERRFLTITFCLVTLLGGPAVYSVIQEPIDLAKDETVSSARQPASLSKANAGEKISQKGIRSKSVVLDFTCVNKKSIQSVAGGLLRLRGSSCFKPGWKDLTVTNKTNGFTAAVIFLNQKKFTTDFIDLNEGVNELKIQAKGEKGETLTQTLNVRRLPASNL